MFQSTKFERTRGNDRGMNMDISHFNQQFEETDIYEDLDMNEYNRSCIKNFGPDRILFPHEEPRRDNHSRWIINLHTEGAKDPTMPYRNDDFDMQFRDHDPRGYLEEQPWRNYRANNEPKLRQRLFGKDADYSVPGEGIHPVDMVNRISSIRREMKGRLQWFDESLGNFATGRSGTHHNSPRGIFGGGQIDMVIPEDSSATVDPTILDSIDRRAVNRIVSNNLHTGSKFFSDRSIPDHVVPVASYGYLFKSYNPQTFRSTTNMMIGDQPIRTLNDRVITNNFMSMLENKTDVPANSLLGTTEQSKFAQMFETQEANKKNMMLNRDIMALMGLTMNEIEYINSMETSNREAHRQCLANVIDMVVALDKLPPNAKLDIRAKLLEARTPEFMGGTCKLSTQDHDIKNILESRTRNNIVDGKIKLQSTGDGSFGGSGTSRNRIAPNIRTPNTSQPTMIDNKFGSSQQSHTRGAQQLRARSGNNTTTVSDMKEPASYNHIFRSKTILTAVNNKLPTEYNENTFEESNTSETTNKFFNYRRRDDNEFDTDMGREHMVQNPLKSWNDSHLIPRQFKR